MIFKNKKGVAVFSEFSLIIFSLLITGLILFFISSMITTVKTEYKTSALELNYEYPLVFVHTFLNTPLSIEDKKIFINYNNINFVKDLFWINDDKSKKMIEKYREAYVLSLTENFLDSKISSIDFFSYFEDSDKVLADDLLYMEYDISKEKLLRVKDYIVGDNLFFPIRTQSGFYSTIYFKRVQ